MTRRFSDLARVPLREHGTPVRVDAIWRRLERGLGGGDRSWSGALRLLVPAALVLVFGAGVFVGARFLGGGSSAAPQVLSAERPLVLEPAGGRALPGALQQEQPKPEPSVRHAQRRTSLAVATPPLELVEEAPLSPVVVAPPVAPSTPGWERLAEAGDFEAARAALETGDGFDGAVSIASPSQLMTLVDIARASGSKERAMLALRRLVTVFPGAPEAPDAAWTLGNMLGQAGDQAGAADAFSLYRRLSPAGDFAQDALAHEVDAAFARGDLELSARLVAQYENEFPNGPRLDELRAELERRTAKLAKPAAPAEPEAPVEDEAEPGAPAVEPAEPPAGKQPSK